MIYGIDTDKTTRNGDRNRFIATLHSHEAISCDTVIVLCKYGRVICIHIAAIAVYLERL